jgi:hypothetical protein
LSPRSLDPRWPSDYRRRGRPFIFVGYLLAAAGIGAILNPEVSDRTTVSQLLSPTADLTWQLAYAIGGSLMALGVLAARPAAEVLGLWLAFYALALNGIALMAVRGFAGSGLALAAYALTAWVVFGRVQDLHAAAKLERRHPPRRGAQHRRTAP